ncbi:MAG: virulence RhuM family protein [Prevotella sp.]|nr:virulence RhuM family protein [Prevotella sp.]
MEQYLEQTGEIVMYQPDETIRLEVRMSDETVWLTTSQMAELFGREESNIRRHVINVFKEKELDRENNVHILHVNGVKRPVPFYTLDVIISVGYRVKSLKGTDFRRWATKILKDHLLQGYSLNCKLQNIHQELSLQKGRICRLEEKMDFFVKTSLPPQQGIFFDGQIFDAYRFVSDLIRKAKISVVLIDNYVDDTVLSLLDKRQDGVKAIVYTKSVNEQLQLDITRHNEQYATIEVKQFNKAHDRFLLIDDEVYHIGASIKDLGKKWFAFTLMHDIKAAELISKMN